MSIAGDDATILFVSRSRSIRAAVSKMRVKAGAAYLLGAFISPECCMRNTGLCDNRRRALGYMRGRVLRSFWTIGRGGKLRELHEIRSLSPAVTTETPLFGCVAPCCPSCRLEEPSQRAPPTTHASVLHADLFRRPLPAMLAFGSMEGQIADALSCSGRGLSYGFMCALSQCNRRATFFLNDLLELADRQTR